MKAYFYIAAALCLIPLSESAAQNRLVSQSGRQTVVKPSGRIVTKAVRVNGGFTEINSRGFADVEFRQTDGQTKIEVRGHENIVELVEIENRGGVLEIGFRRNTSVRGQTDLKIMVSAPRIAKISAHGSGDIGIQGPLESPNLEIMSYGSGDVRVPGSIESGKLDISMYGSGDMRFGRFKADQLRLTVRGSGDMEGQSAEASNIDITVYGSGDVDISRIMAETANITLSGSGDIEADGRVREAVYKLRGSGDIDADGLRAEKVDATLSGSGDISCHASSSLRAAASGSGTIDVSGNPAAVDIKGNKRAVRFR